MKIIRVVIFNFVLFGHGLMAAVAPDQMTSGGLSGRLQVTSGYVLTHEHPTYGMSFGGNYAFAGAAGNYRNGVMENGYTALCGGCGASGNCDHGEVKGNLAGLSGALGGDMRAHVSHMGPKHNSNSHLRYSTEWVKEAFSPSEEEFRGTNMKIMVAFAMESETMCDQLYHANKGNGGAGGEGFPCTRGDSWASLKRQLDSIKNWAYENRDWMQVAYSASEARSIVNSNKLAIILGIESEYAFGAEDRTFDPVRRLNRYYNEGVRTFYIAHKINSRLSGADIYGAKGSMSGKAMRLNQALAGCFYYDDNVGEFPLKGRLGKNLCDNNCGDNAFKGGKLADKCSYKMSDISDANMADYITRGGGRFNGFRLYPKPPSFTRSGDRGGSTVVNKIERNNLGLSDDGARVVREAMRKGMIVNIDHVSSRARKHIYNISINEFNSYPLNALHNKPNSQLTDSRKYKRHEYDFDENELQYIKETGGFFGFRMGPTNSVDYPKSGITIDCPDTSTESAKMLAWLIDQEINVGYSLDYATVTKGVESRTSASCGINVHGSTDQLHTYGRHITQGLSHIGVMKKWHQELVSIGLKQEYLDVLKDKGVESFLQMWGNSEERASSGTQAVRKKSDLKPVPARVNCKKNSTSGKRRCKPLK